MGCRFSRSPSPNLVNHLHNILIADDDDGHAFLVEDSLRRGGLNAHFLRFADDPDGHVRRGFLILRGPLVISLETFN